MSYTIKKSDGTILLTLADTKVDELTTSLSLIGKNVSSYGQYFNNDLVALLENFASTDEPRSPLVGQLWFNKLEGRLYVFETDNTFRPVTGTLLAGQTPVVFKQGDFWINTSSKQLYFSPDGIDFTLAGPQYSVVDGKSGWIVETIADSVNVPRIVASLYNNDTLLCIASSATFTFKTTYHGMTNVALGINLNTSIAGIRFVGTATSTDQVMGFSPGDYLTKTGDNIAQGSLTVHNNTGVIIGTSADLALYVADSNANVTSQTTDHGLRLKGINSDVGPFTGLQLDAANKRIGVFTETPQVEFDVVGNTHILGDLDLDGTLYSTGTNVFLAYGNESDTFIDGAGITISGDKDHTISWTQSYNGSWQINDHLNLSSSLFSYKINGNPVVNSTSLGSIIASAPGLTSVGVLSYLTVSNIVIAGSTIWATGTNATLHLGTGLGVGTIDVSGRKVTTLSTCTNPLDAANKSYVDFKAETSISKGFGITIDITGVVDVDTYIIGYLDRLFPVVNPVEDALFDLLDGIRARVLCANYIVNLPTQILTINKATTLINNTQTVVTDVAGELPAFSQAPTVTYTVKEYKVLSGVWAWSQDIP